MSDEKQIREQAKKIMDNFMRALEKVPQTDRYGTEREKFLREPDEDNELEDHDFQKNMLENAPKTKDDCIQAEKKKW